MPLSQNTQNTGESSTHQSQAAAVPNPMKATITPATGIADRGPPTQKMSSSRTSLLVLVDHKQYVRAHEQEQRPGSSPGPEDLFIGNERSRNPQVRILDVNRRTWIPERSATRLREADLNVFSKLGNQDLEGRLEAEAFTGGEVRREDDLLDFLVGCPVDIQVARQPST